MILDQGRAAVSHKQGIPTRVISRPKSPRPREALAQVQETHRTLSAELEALAVALTD
jgi:hypothetical protein